MGYPKRNDPAKNGLFDRISADLKKRDLKYMGSITVYSHLQACGMINDYGEGSSRYQELIACTGAARKPREQEN